MIKNVFNNAFTLYLKNLSILVRIHKIPTSSNIAYMSGHLCIGHLVRLLHLLSALSSTLLSSVPSLGLLDHVEHQRLDQVRENLELSSDKRCPRFPRVGRDHEQGEQAVAPHQEKVVGFLNYKGLFINIVITFHCSS